MNKIRFVLTLIMVLTFGIVLASCEKTGKTTTTKQSSTTTTKQTGTTTEEQAEYAIILDKTKATLTEGQTLTLTPTVKKNGQEVQAEVTWESSNTAVATVENGVVRAVSPGTVTIKAKAFGKEVTCVITVEEVFLLLNKTSLSLLVNEEETLIAEMTDGSTPELTWTSSDETVATVDQNGKVKAIKAGTATIRVTSGNLSAEATVTVGNNAVIIFPELDGQYFVGDTVELNIQVNLNGELVNDGYTVTGQGFTYADGKITIDKSGPIEVSVQYPEALTVKQSFAAYNKVSTKADLDNIANDLTGYYMLVNDIDLEGQHIQTIASYNNGHTSASTGFRGVFDGNGHTIANFYPTNIGGTQSNNSLFGVIGTGGVVRNLNLVNVELKDRIAASIAALNYGTIEDVFVAVYITYNPGDEANNPQGGIAAKNWGVIRNAVVYLTAKEGTNLKYVGGIAGRTYDGSGMYNAFVITETEVALHSSVTPGNAPQGFPGTYSNAEKYFTIEELYEKADFTGFGEEWTIVEGFLPHVGTISDEVDITNVDDTMFNNQTKQINFTYKYGARITIKEDIEGITIDNKGLITVSETVPGGTVFTVVVKSLFDSEAVIEFEVTVLANEYEISSDQDVYEFDYIVGVSPEEQTKALHGVTVLYRGEAYNDYQIVSTNENIAIVDGEYIIAKNAGTVTFNVVINGEVLYTFAVVVEAKYPIYTTQDFLAIANNQETLSRHYVLMNDLDFEGAQIDSFTSYYTNLNQQLNFKGIFDGQGYTIKNFEPSNNKVNANDNDRSVFGYITKDAIIRNINFTGVVLNRRSAVVAVWNEGTIENIYIEAVTGTDASNRNANNPGSVAIIKNQATGRARNIVVNLTVHPNMDITYLGGIIGVNSSNDLENLHLITSNSELKIINNDTKNLQDKYFKYASLEEFYQNANLEAFDENWTLVPGFFPHLGEMEEEIDTTNVISVLYPGQTYQLSVPSKYQLRFQLKDEVLGVTVSETGIITVSQDITEEEEITIVVASLYDATFSQEITITIKPESFEASTAEDIFEFTWINREDEPEANFKALHGIVILKNGEVYSGEYEVVSANPNIAVVEGDYVIARGDGRVTLAIRVNGASLFSFEVVSNMYTPIYTAQDFENINNNLTGKYILMNDIDFGGQGVNTIGHYGDGHTTPNSGFRGIFDGNGYTMSNFYPVLKSNPSSANSSLFGTIGATGVIRNLNLVGVELKTRIAGGLGTMNFGTIENVFVDVYISYASSLSGTDINNPMGGLVSKNYGLIKNTVVVLEMKPENITSLTGGIAGRTFSTETTGGNSHIYNSFVITKDNIGVHQEATPTNTPMGFPGIFENTQKFSSIEEFYQTVDTTVFDEVWQFTEGRLPYVGTLIDELVPVTSEIFQGDSLQLQVENKYGVTFTLKEAVDGVTLTETGLLTVSDTVEIDTEIEIIVTSIFGELVVVEFTVVVKENSFEVDANFDSIEFTWIQNESSEEDYQAEHGIVVTINGNPYTGDDVVITSSNPNVVIINGAYIVAVGDGQATITVYVKTKPMYTIDVVSNMYTPIYTVADFLAINTNIQTLSKKYILMNDLDLGGQALHTIAHYNEGYQSASNGFLGIFDGNGHTISNFYPIRPNNETHNSNSSLFGTVGQTAIIRNLNVVGVVLKGRIAGGIATINYGTIENVFVQAHFTYNINTDVNNPMGGVVSKNYGTIRNAVAVVSIKPGIYTNNIGGVVGRTYNSNLSHENSEIYNSYVITTLDIGIFEAEIPSGGFPGATENVEKYQTVEEFYDNVDLENFDEIWNFVEGRYPYVGTLKDVITTESEEIEVEVDSSVELLVTSKYGVTFALQEEVEGVTLTETGLLTVADTVEVGTEFTVVVTSIFGEIVTLEINVTVVEGQVTE